MSKLCPICGSELVDNKCPNQESHFKPMCLNCTECKEDPRGHVCSSEVNMRAALTKIMNAVPDLNYEITLNPLPLKNPQKKCKLWNPDTKRILDALLHVAVPEANNKEKTA